MQQRRGTADQWTNANPILNAAEIGWESDTNQFKIGDGTNHWNDLPYFVDVTTLSTELGDYVEVSQLGVANGVATLNSAGVLESSQLPDISEITADTMNDVFVAGSGVTKVYDDNANTITLSVDTSILDEMSQDAIDAALVAGAGIEKSYDDNANTITLSVVANAIPELDAATFGVLENMLVASDGVKKEFGPDSNTYVFSIDNTVVRLSTTQVLEGKTIDLANNTIIATLEQLNEAIRDADVLSTNAVQEVSNKVIHIGNNSVTGTIAEFNEALLDGNFATLQGAETLENKTISLGNNTVTATVAQLNTALSDGDVATLEGAETLHNKTISLANNTITGTIAEFNAAVHDADFATIAGAETLYNKTLDLANNVLSGTFEQFNSAVSDTDLVDLSSNQTLLNKTIDSANNTITVTSTNVSDFVEAAVDASANALVSGTHTNILVTYDDANGTISLSGAEAYSDEQAQDAVGNAIGSGLTYDDNTGAISVDTTSIQARVADVSDTEIGYLANVTSDIQSQIDGKLGLSGGTMTGFITLHADPTQAMHATTKEYVDNVASGILAKPSVLAATTANLSANYNNGTDGVGATLTATSNGAFPLIDGVTVTTENGQRGVLVKNQTNPAHNGRYNLTTQGDAGTPWVLTRCGLCDESSEIPGAYIFVTDGTNNGQTGWVLHVTDPATFTVGTDSITAFQFSGAGTYTAGTGISINGNQIGISNSLMASFIADPFSESLRTAVVDETGTGNLVFNTDAVLVTPRTQLAMNTQTGTSYTLVLADAYNKLVRVGNSSAITVTVPPSVFSVGDSIMVQQTGAGQITFAQGSGVTITSAGATVSAPKIRTTHASATVICTAANTFTIIGDIV